ncbi:MAG: DUF2793 domain-containing protein [Pseudomonadota bacterium]
MTDTPNLNLALIDPAQAQKHITVNEVIARLDCLVAGSVNTSGQTTPPAIVDGEAHIIGAGASGAWTGHDQEIAFAINGGWSFYVAQTGWQVWSLESHQWLFFGGAVWVPQVVACSPGSAVTAQRVLEFDHVLSAAASSTSDEMIPDKAIVFGISARVIAPIDGAASWSLGVPGNPDRYGSGFGTSLNSSGEGVTGQPLAYYGGTPVVITAQGGSFTSGTLRIAVHYQSISAPRPV